MKKQNQFATCDVGDVAVGAINARGINGVGDDEPKDEVFDEEEEDLDEVLVDDEEDEEDVDFDLDDDEDDDDNDDFDLGDGD